QPAASATAEDPAPHLAKSVRSARLSEVEIADSSGVRTFSVLALLGFVGGLLAESYPWVAPTALAAATAIVVALYLRATQEGLGITTELAAIAVTGLGMLCRVDYHVAAVIGLLLAVVLASKRLTHAMVRKVRRVELTDTLKFLVVILIVLPLLPNRAIDPYQAFNPYKVGVLVVLISGIGFAGYFLTRFLGAQKGLGLTGIIGGLTSSTAVTAAMAQRAKEQPSLRAICAFSTVAANATMFARVLVVVALIDRPLFQRLLWSLGGMTVVAAAAAVFLWFTAGKAQKAEGDEGREEVPLENPFSLGPAIKFAAFFVFILFLLQLAKRYLGDSGLYLAAAVSGLADVDAITLSASDQVANGQMVAKVGAIAITIAVVSNSVTKTGIAITAGGWAFGRLVGAALAVATGFGLVLAFVM
ncbi:MAG: DUF4010 domain-containing protein, partial [Myxococcales bacterium]|nr:DUF4010 domain-containing protein [Myxococcales bacterium]